MDLVEISFRRVPRSSELDAVIRREAEKLERYANNIVGCRVAVEQPQHAQRHGSSYHLGTS